MEDTLIVKDSEVSGLFEGLKLLKCCNKNIKKLPTLPKTLRELICESCSSLSVLPELPEGLEELWINCTSISSLPVLPESLKILNINQTPIVSLPNIPRDLESLYGFPREFKEIESLFFGLGPYQQGTIYNAGVKVHLIKILYNHKEQKQKIKWLEEENEKLKEQIRIMPGGNEYFEAMEHYKQLRELALKD